MRSSFVFATIIVFIILSCRNSNAVKALVFEENCWNLNDTITYDITIGPDFLNSDFKLEVRFAEDYAYRNFYYKCQFISPQGQTFDTLFHQIMVDEQGHWNKESSSGKTYIYEFPLTIPPQMKELGSYKVNVFHYMRDTDLCEIKKIAILN